MTKNQNTMKSVTTNFWRRTTGQDYMPRFSRLAGELDSYRPQLERRISNYKGTDTEWPRQARELVDKAWELLRMYKIDEAWKVFHTAKRMEYFGMNDEERLAVARSLAEEVAKLNEWRRDAVLALLGKGTGPLTVTPTPEALSMAAELKDEYYNNQYYKNKLSRNIFRLLFTLLFLAIAGIVLYSCLMSKRYGENFQAELNQTQYLVGILLFGFLGAITSAILFTRYMSKSSRITEIGSSQVITISKIFVGAAFSVFIFLLLKSSIADNIKIFAFNIKDPLDYFAVAFVSGFSERLAQKAIEAVVGTDSKEDTKSPPPSEA
jgi:hypothetical protein